MTIETTLTEITGPMGVSGDERDITDCITAFLNDADGRTSVDHIGNILYNVTEDTKVIFTAHMDEIGLMVSGHTDEGHIEFVTVGGFDPRTLPNTQVEFAEGWVGVIGTPAPHLVKDRNSVIDIENLTIDCGFTSKEEAVASIPVGETCVITSRTFTVGDTFFSRNTDNRAGCAVLLELVEFLPKDCGLAFLVREEVGLMGMKALCDRIKPEVVINLDVTPSGELGTGPVVTMKDGGYLADRALVEDLKLCGIENIEVGKGGTSDHAIGQLYARSAGIGFPSAYIHSSVSKVNLKDLEHAVDVCRNYIEMHTYENTI